MITSIESADDLFGMESYHKLVLTMLTIIIFCIRVWTMTTVWYNFQANTCSKKAAPGCFEFTGAQRCCGGSSHEFCGKFNLAVVGGSETQTTEKRSGIVVASPLRSIINDQVQAMREAGIWVIALSYRGTMSWCGHSVRRVSSSCSLSWKLAFKKENPARGLPTW